MDRLGWFGISGCLALAGGWMLAGWWRFPYHYILGLVLTAVAFVAIGPAIEEPKNE